MWADAITSHDINKVNKIRLLYSIQECNARHKQNCISSPNTEKSNLVYQLTTSTKEAIRCVPINSLDSESFPAS